MHSLGRIGFFFFYIYTKCDILLVILAQFTTYVASCKNYHLDGSKKATRRPLKIDMFVSIYQSNRFI